jgi:hypothetical protein
VRVRLLACQPRTTHHRRTIHLLEIAGVPDAIESAVAALRATSASVIVSVASPTRALVRIEALAEESCSLLFASGATCRACQFLSPVAADGTASWEVLGPRAPTDRAGAVAWRRLFDGPRTLRRVRTYRGPGEPTDRQREALQAAHRLGYFAVPRRGGLGEVARELRVSRSTAAELIRRGTAGMLESAPEDLGSGDLPEPGELAGHDEGVSRPVGVGRVGSDPRPAARPRRAPGTRTRKRPSR